MILRHYLSSLTKPELELLKEECNLSDEEDEIFMFLAKGKYAREIAFKTSLSEKTVDRRICRIRFKVEKILAMKGGALM